MKMAMNVGLSCVGIAFGIGLGVLINTLFVQV